MIWNSLPLSVRHSSSFSSFKSKIYIYIMSLLFCILLLHTDIFFSLNQPITSNACICKVCACACVRACVGVKERERVRVCVRVRVLMCDVK